MGDRDKLLEPVDGMPLLRGVALRALGVSADVIVTLPDVSHPRADALHGLAVTQIAVPDARDGMSASLRRAAKAVPDGTEGLMILPADMPDLCCKITSCPGRRRQGLLGVGVRRAGGQPEVRPGAR